ncbi:MAG: pseudaminic acid biosynthesis-associated methylase, partial [Solirubrobacteraceae bacterium]
MSPEYETQQEAFWAGSFGDEYIQRNQGEQLVASATALLARALSGAEAISSCIEFGCNIGMKLAALKRLLPDVELAAVEINATAARQAASLGADVHEGSILEFEPLRTYD